VGQFFAIFRNTVVETVRQPVYALVLVIMCFLVAIMPAFSAQIYTFGAGSGLEHSAERMLADLGLATVLLAGLVLAVFSTASVISREIDNRTALTVLSKRVSRWVFVLGKYAGVAVAILLATLTGTVMILLTVRVGPKVAVSDPLDYGVIASMIAVVVLAVSLATFRNYFRGRSWVGSFALSFVLLAMLVFAVFLLFDKEYHFIFLPRTAAALDPGAAASGDAFDTDFANRVTYDWDVARAAVLTVEAVLLMAGVAVAASTRLGVGGNCAVSAVAFLGGLTSSTIHGEVALRYAALPRPSWLDALVLSGTKLWRALLPDLQTFWMSDALTREQPIPFSYLTWASGYAACYVAATLLVAMFLFERREVS